MKSTSIALALFVLAGCGARQDPGAFVDELPPPALLPAEALGPDVLLRQRVAARWESGETSFDAVVQKHEGRLRLVALSPTGQPGFVIELDERGEVHVENRTGETLPFQPARILADIQKVHYPWLTELGAATPAEGTRRGPGFEGEVEERRSGGRLVERRFFAEVGDEAPTAVVSYEGWGERRVAPERATIVHSRFGYELTVETVEELVLSE